MAIATALTLNVDRIYIAGDQLLGHRNLLDLTYDIQESVGQTKRPDRFRAVDGTS